MAGGPERPTLAWVGKRRPSPPEVAEVRLRLAIARSDEPPDELYRGDNLELLAHLRARYRGAVDLVYLDPPFCSQADYKRTIRPRTAEARARRLESVEYSDTWTAADYLQFMYERLSLCHELLGERGALFLHCDWHQSHRLRCVLDELFGPENFQNEIVWHYYNKLQGNVGRFAANHDSILFYSKSRDFAFTRIRERRAQPIRQIKRVWSKDKRAIVNARGPDGKIAYVTSTHKTIDDVWRVSMLQPADRREAVGYPTQKPEALLERILAAASEPGALVLDPFMGSGTTAAVAYKLGRRFIGIDRGRAAVSTTLRRLVNARESIAGGGGEASIKNGLDEVARRARPNAGLAVYEAGARDRSRAAAIDLEIRENRVCIVGFRPGPLLDELGIEPHDWPALVDAVFVDFDHDGLVVRPARMDVPRARARVEGSYALPPAPGLVAVCVVDLLGEVWTATIDPRASARPGL